VTRATAGDLVNAARLKQKAVGAFNVILLEHAEAIVTGAETAKLPVILQISQNCVRYHGTLKPISVAAIALAEAAGVPVSVHLDHAESEELIKEALDLGYDSVMFDGSKLPYSQNVASSARVALLCKSYGATLEVEIGEVGGKDGVHAPGVRTDPKEAQRFANATGADLLAVAVGSSHAMTTRSAVLDLALVSEIFQMVSIPLVLHGSSGVQDRDLKEGVRTGMSKINIATHLNQIFTNQIRAILKEDSSLNDPRRYIGNGRDAISVEVARLLLLLGD
jgi:fructose-bisphosphate aldolase class II